MSALIKWSFKQYSRKRRSTQKQDRFDIWFVGPAAYQVLNLVACFFSVDQREKVWFSLKHTQNLSIFSHSLLNSLKHSLLSDIVKGQEGQNDHKKLWLWQRHLLQTDVCQQKPIQRGWWTTPAKHASVSLLPSFLFFTIRSHKQASALQYIQTKTCSLARIDILQWQKIHYCLFFNPTLLEKRACGDIYANTLVAFARFVTLLKCQLNDAKMF